MDDRFSARRGTYRVIYRIDDKTRIVTVVDIPPPARRLPQLSKFSVCALETPLVLLIKATALTAGDNVLPHSEGCAGAADALAQVIGASKEYLISTDYGTRKMSAVP
jgi:hypothetical protein